MNGLVVRRDVLSTEYVTVNVYADVDPLSDTVAIALVLSTDTDPTWLASSEWVPGQTWVDGMTPVQARCLVGPAGGDMTLDENFTYAVKVKVTDNPEVPVFTAYHIRGV